MNTNQSNSANDLSANQFPECCLIGIEDSQRGKTEWFCSGVLIHQEWILVPKRCFEDSSRDKAELKIALITSNGEDSGELIVADASSRVEISDGIELIRLNCKAISTDPANWIPVNSIDIDVEQPVEAVGFNMEAGPKKNRDSYKVIEQRIPGLVKIEEVCSSLDKGDFLGPVYVGSDDQWILVGLVSGFTDRCLTFTLLTRQIYNRILEVISPDLETQIIPNDSSRFLRSEDYPECCLIGIHNPQDPLGGWFCSGVLVDKQWIIVSEHCFSEEKSRETAQLKIAFYTSNGEDSQEVILAKSVNRQTVSGDIQLLPLEKEATKTSPGRLTQGLEYLEMKVETKIVGFGPTTTETRRKGIGTFRVVSTYKLSLGGTYVDVVSSDALAYPGDSGGPVYLEQQGERIIVGIVHNAFGKAPARGVTLSLITTKISDKIRSITTSI